MTIYRYKAFNQSELASIQSTIEHSLGQCFQGWLDEELRSLRVENAADCGQDKGPILQDLISHAEEQGVASKNIVCLKGDLRSLLAKRLSSAPQDLQSDYGRELVDQFFEDIQESIASESAYNDDSAFLPLARPASECRFSGSGWVYAECQLQQGAVICMLFAGLLVLPSEQKHLPTKNFAQLSELIQGEDLNVDARLGQANLSIGEFKSLEPGNVLVLDAPLTERVNVLVSGDVIAKGRLVKVGDQRAIQIVKK